MKDTARVPERLLERLRLGELGEEESRDVLERLEREEGGPRRLEALIEDDERFLLEHPPERMVPAIRARARRAAKRGGPRPSLRWAAVGLVAAAAGGAVLLRPRGRDAIAPDPAGAGAPAPAQRAAPSVESPVLRSDGKNARGLAFGAAAGEEGADVIVERGQIVTLRAERIDRVVVGDEAVVVATGSPERTYLEARALGATSVRFFAGGRLVRHAALRVLEPLDRGAVESASAEGAEVTARCFRGADAPDAALRVRFATGAGGEVTSALVEWSTTAPAVERCALDAVRAWRLPAAPSARTGAVRLAAREARVCVPGKEC